MGCSSRQLREGFPHDEPWQDDDSLEEEWRCCFNFVLVLVLVPVPDLVPVPVVRQRMGEEANRLFSSH